MSASPFRIGLDARKWEDGGIGTYLQALARTLPAALPEASSWIAFVRPEQAERFRSGAPSFETIPLDVDGYSLREPLALARVAREARLDLLHCPHWVVPFRSPCPVVTTIHDAIPTDPRFFSLPKRLVARFAIRRALASSTRVVTVSRAARADLIERFGPVAKSVRAIPNGIDIEPPLDHEEAGRLASSWLGRPLPPGGFLLAIANHRPHKGLATLVDALGELHHRAGVELLLVGAEGNGEAVRKIVRPLPPPWGEATRILSRAPRPVMRALFRSCLATVIPSHLEGFGLPLLEAMAEGATVLASEIAPHREVGGEIPFWFPPGDAIRLARLIEELLEGRLDTGPGKIAGVVHSHRFTWARAAGEIAETYREALGGR
jgi:glycosyltransferase involved in cell wall biosynthesis